MARHGGGAFSGKDPSKVDRSAAYAARWVAKHVVAAGAAKRCEVQVAYAIGVAHPVSLLVETFGTEAADPEKISDAVRDCSICAPRPSPGTSICVDRSTRRPRPTATSVARRRSSPGRPHRGSTTCGPPWASSQPVPPDRAPAMASSASAPASDQRCRRYGPSVRTDVAAVPSSSTTPSRTLGRPGHGRDPGPGPPARPPGRGWVTEDNVSPPAGVTPAPLAQSSLGWGPPANVVTLAEWAAWRWAGPLSFFLQPPRRPVVRAIAAGAARHRRTPRRHAPGRRRGRPDRMRPWADPIRSCCGCRRAPTSSSRCSRR